MDLMALMRKKANADGNIAVVAQKKAAGFLGIFSFCSPHGHVHFGCITLQKGGVNKGHITTL